MSKPKALSERQWFKHTHPISLIRHLEATRVICHKNRFGKKMLVLISALCRRLIPLLKRSSVGTPTEKLIGMIELFSDGELTAYELIRACVAWRELGLNNFTNDIAITDKLGPDTCRLCLAPRTIDNQQKLHIQELPGEVQRRLHLGAQAISLYTLDYCGEYDPSRQDESMWLLQGILHAALAVGGYEAPAELEYQCGMIRDIFGNPFQKKPKVATKWFTSNVVQLAQQMHDTRDYSAMPILGDALMDAGCEDEAIIAHCQAKAPHVRGCWLIDLLLGRK